MLGFQAWDKDREAEPRDGQVF